MRLPVSSKNRRTSFSASDPLMAYLQKCVSAPVLGVDGYELDKAQKGIKDVTMHASALPACSVHLYLKALQRRVNIRNLTQHGIVPTAESEQILETYGHLGTLRHALIQKAAGQGDKMLGDWWSEKRKKLYRVCNYARAVALSGDPDVKYQEIGLQLRLGGRKALSCHFDGVFEHDGELWVIDYKFKTTWGMKGKLPVPKNEIQLKTYVSACREFYKRSRLKNVVGYALVYCAFDNARFDQYNTKIVWKRISDKEHKKTLAELNALAGGLHVANDAAEQTMETGKFKPAVKQVLGAKLCPTLKHYQTKVEPLFECEFADICHRKGDAMTTTIIKKARQVHKA